MKKKHVVKIGYRHFATDSVSAATDLVKLLSKFEAVEWVYESASSHYRPDSDRDLDFEIKLNQPFLDPNKPDPKQGPLRLPKPKKGSILCMCEKSYVAPRNTCPSCGLAFNVSHSRTHDGTAKQTNFKIL